MRKALIGLSVIIGGGVIVTPALADRPPTTEERAAIERVLRDQGYVSWEEIEFDDGVWEVDDARAGDGLEYDLKLDPDSLQIIRRDRDD